MALDIKNVQAGELITSSLVNELIVELEKLDVRVTVLEATGVTSGQVEINAVYPDPVRATDDLTIVGKNFGVSIGATRVRFNGVPPKNFRLGSNDNVLICDVPELTGIDPAGTLVELTVANAVSAATRSITVTPLQKQQVGDADIVFTDVTPDPTIPGQPADFAFTLHSDALLPADIILTPSVTSAAGTSLGWTTSILDAIKNPIADRKVAINKGETKAFFVHVAIPSGTNDVNYILRVDGAGGGLTGSSGAQALQVGHEAKPDPAIPDLSPIGVTNGSLNGSTVTATGGEWADIDVEVHMNVAPATYNVSFAVASGTTGWTTDMVSPPESAPKIDVAPTDLTQTGPPPYHRDTITVSVRATSNTSPRGQAVLTVQRQGENRKRSYTFDLAVLQG
jgi:hypothetical protein